MPCVQHERAENELKSHERWLLIPAVVLVLIGVALVVWVFISLLKEDPLSLALLQATAAVLVLGAIASAMMDSYTKSKRNRLRKQALLDHTHNWKVPRNSLTVSSIDGLVRFAHGTRPVFFDPKDCKFGIETRPKKRFNNLEDLLGFAEDEDRKARKNLST